MGMTDLQFKAYIRMLLRVIENINEDRDKEEILATIGKLRQDLEEVLQG